jgi:acyl carrier protein
MPPAAFLRRPAAWLEAVTQYKAALTGGPNFAFDLCCRRVTAAELTSLDLSSLKLLACGGEPVRPETLVAFAEKFAARGFEAKVLSPGYGMAESVLMITSSASETRIGLPIVTIDGRDVVSCGAVIEGHELRVVDPITFESCDDGETGELWARGPSVAAGYWQRDAESAEVFGATAADGSGPWLRTGDLGLLHDGAVVVTGRRKELIIVRGHNHYPTDIEHTAQCSHEALEPGAGAAFSVSTPAGERVVLVQEISRAARRHVDAAQLIDGLRMAVSEEHGIALHAVVLVEPLSVPKTSSGKVQRLLCKERWLDGSLMVVASEGATVATAAPSTALDPQLVSEVLTLVARESRRESVALDGVLRGNVGFDSLGFVELIVTVEDELKVKISEDLAAKIATVGDLAHVVAASRIAKTEVGITDIRSHMMEQIPQLRVEVEEQRGRDLLVDGRWIADFASANYLGLDLHPDVIASVQPAIEKWGVHPSWTRIVASPAIYGTLERKIATFIGAPDVLVFPTVTLLHAGMLPLLAGPRGAIFVDKEAHASVHDGAALAATRGATVIVYEHGDHEALAALLAESTAPAKIIATDGVYSMSADYEDLHTLVALAKKHDARLYVDDAHGFGVVGANPTSSDPYGAGNGLVARAGLGYAADNIIYVAGMSKAFSSLAAFVTCADAAEKMLFATAGTAVFTGPCPTASLATAIAGIDVVAREGAELRSRLHALTTKLVNGARALGFAVDNHDAFPLIGVVIGKTSATISACRTLWDHGILITPGLFPATPHDRGLLRFTLTAANTEAQVERALDALADVRGVLPKSGTMLKAA